MNVLNSLKQLKFCFKLKKKKKDSHDPHGVTGKFCQKLTDELKTILVNKNNYKRYFEKFEFIFHFK